MTIRDLPGAGSECTIGVYGIMFTLGGVKIMAIFSSIVLATTPVTLNIFEFTVRLGVKDN